MKKSSVLVFICWFALMNFSPVRAAEETITKSEDAVIESGKGLCEQESIEIRRSQFTSDIIDREPADELAKIYRAPQRLYYYTDVVHAKGQKVTHEWFLNGTSTHRVVLNIGSNRWRTWSYLSGVNLSQGTWRVTATSEQGCVLADTRLEFSQGAGASHHVQTPVAATNSRMISGDTLIISSLLTDDISWTGADHCLADKVQNDVEELYFFTEVFGKKGAPIIHQWQHNLRNVKSKKFILESNRQRFTSTLGVEDFAKGMWQINILDSKGGLLGSHRFDIESKPGLTETIPLENCGLHTLGFKQLVPSGQVNSLVKLEQFGASLNPKSSKDFEVVIDAVSIGNIDILEYLKSKGFFHYDQTNSLGQTALMIASEKGTNKVIQWLLDGGVNVNEQSKFSKMTPLYYAVSNNQVDTVRLLLDKGADPNLATSYQHTALMKAADDCNAVLYQMLVDAGGDKFHTNLSGKSAVKIAMECEEPLISPEARARAQSVIY